MLYKDYDYLMKNYVTRKVTMKDIAQECGVSVSAVEKWIHKLGISGLRPREIYSINESKIAHTPEMYYYAGLVSTDGYIDNANHRIAIRLRNDGAEELFTSLKSYFEFTGNIRKYKNLDYDLTITSKKLIEFLESLGIVGKNKTYTLQAVTKFPNEDCARMYLRGVLDGDGNIHLRVKDGRIQSGNFRLVTASDSFMKGIQKVLYTYLGIDTPLKTQTIKGVKYPLIDLHIQESRDFYRWVYKGYTHIRLKDKFTKAHTIVEDIV